MNTDKVVVTFSFTAYIFKNRVTYETQSRMTVTARYPSVAMIDHPVYTPLTAPTPPLCHQTKTKQPKTMRRLKRRLKRSLMVWFFLFQHNLTKPDPNPYLRYSRSEPLLTLLQIRTFTYVTPDSNLYLTNYFRIPQNARKNTLKCIDMDVGIKR